MKQSSRTYLQFCVLIDTWWNVNRIEFVQNLVCNAVLIDTWWNVNQF